MAPPRDGASKGRGDSKRRAHTASAASSSKQSFSLNTNELSYLDFDSAIDAGVESEEKGERHHFGPKAQRYFELAHRLYLRAAQLRPTSADAVYNAARVQYLLATSFYLPPGAVATLVDSVLLFKSALRLAPSLPDPTTAVSAAGQPLPSPFTLDVINNLATSLQSLAELVDEVGWISGLKPAQRLADVTDYTSFQSFQLAVEPRFPSSSKLLQEAASFYRDASLGQEQVLIDQANEGAQAAGSETDLASVGEEGMQEEDVMDQTDGSQLNDVGYTSSLVTVDTYVDTLLSLHACFVTLLSSCETIQQAQACTASANEALDRASTALLSSASSALPSLDAAEMATKTNELHRARLSLRVAHVSRLADLATSFPSSAEDASEIEQLEDALLSWAGTLLAPPSEGAATAVPADTATLCELGDAGLSLCRLRLRHLRREGPLPSSLGAIERAWTLGTTTSKLFNAALSTLSTASASSHAVLGATNTSTPTSRTRASILTALVATSLLRATPVFEASQYPNAQGTRSKLLDNARIYGRKACVEVGLGWLLQSPPSTTGTAHPSALSHPHAHGGWETLRAEADLVMHLARALWIRGTARPETKPDVERELTTLLANVTALCTRRDASYRLAFVAGSTRQEEGGEEVPAGAERFVADLRDEEGVDCLSEDEVTFWSSWTETIRAALAAPS